MELFLKIFFYFNIVVVVICFFIQFYQLIKNGIIYEDLNFFIIFNSLVACFIYFVKMN